MLAWSHKTLHFGHCGIGQWRIYLGFAQTHWDRECELIDRDIHCHALVEVDLRVWLRFVCRFLSENERNDELARLKAENSYQLARLVVRSAACTWGWDPLSTWSPCSIDLSFSLVPLLHMMALRPCSSSISSRRRTFTSCWMDSEGKQSNVEVDWKSWRRKFRLRDPTNILDTVTGNLSRTLYLYSCEPCGTAQCQTMANNVCSNILSWHIL